MSGIEVVRTVLDRDFGEVDFYGHSFCGSTVAETATCPSGVTLDPNRFAVPQQELMNTLAHELTHLVPEEGIGGECRYRYTDDKHSECTEHRLVSYRLGKMVECQVTHGSTDKEFDDCVGDKAIDESCVAIINDLTSSCRK